MNYITIQTWAIRITALSTGAALIISIVINFG